MPRIAQIERRALMIAGEVLNCRPYALSLQKLLSVRNVSVIYRENRKLALRLVQEFALHWPFGYRKRRRELIILAPSISGESLLCSAATFGGNCYRLGGHDLLRIGG